MCPTNFTNDSDVLAPPAGPSLKSAQSIMPSIFSSLREEDFLSNTRQQLGGNGAEAHPLHASRFANSGATGPAGRTHKYKQRHSKHRRYKTMDVVPTYMKPIPVQRPEPIVEESQETFGWGDFPVSKRMLPIPGQRKHRRYHTAF